MIKQQFVKQDKFPSEKNEKAITESHIFNQ